MLTRHELPKVYSVLLMAASFLFMVVGLWSLISEKVWLWSWVLWKGMSSEFTFVMLFDWMSMLFFALVAFISSSVMFYSESYMAEDLNKERFTHTVFLFVLSMFFMIFSLTLVSIMLGWDGLGVISYILVIHYQNEKCESAGMITALSNRVGDACLLLTIALLVESSNWSLNTISLAPNQVFTSGLAFLVILAAITKSAQIPFSAWLPAAMAAPTPVSALVHSSTLVTAGVYLMIRFSPIIYSSGLAFSLAILGSLTTLMASIGANLEQDLKKIIALSTLSQLGIMVTTLGAGLPSLTYFHMMAHAMFKALLFMCGGKVIHEVAGAQDARSMGGAEIGIPYTATYLNISNLALCGFPFLTGFYSKDLLAEMMTFLGLSTFMVLALGAGIGLSASYSIRLTYYSLISEVSQKPLLSVSENKTMMLSKLGLLTMSILGGAGLSYLMFPYPLYLNLPLSLKTMTMSSVVLGILLGILLSKGFVPFNFNLAGFLTLHMNSHMWFLPFISGALLSKASFYMNHSLKKMDQGWFELAGAQGTYSFINIGSSTVDTTQFNSIKVFLSSFGMVLVFGVVYNYLSKF